MEGVIRAFGPVLMAWLERFEWSSRGFGQLGDVLEGLAVAGGGRPSDRSGPLVPVASCGCTSGEDFGGGGFWCESFRAWSEVW